MSELPKSWAKIKIDECCEVIAGQSPSGDTYNDNGVGLPFYQGKAEFGDLYPTPRKWCDKPTKIARSGDVLISVRAPVGPTNLSAEECCIGRGLAALRPRPGVQTKFVLYQMRFTERKLAEYATGSTFSAVSSTQVRSHEINLAPSNEQRRIVAKIEELFSELDKGVEALTSAREQLNVYRQSVLKYAFEGNLTADLRETHKAWRRTRLGDELEYLTSGSRGWAEYYAESGDIFIRAQNLKHDRLDLTDIAFVSLPEGNTEGIRTRVRVGDILITITGANVTKTGIVDSDLGAAYVSQHVALYRPSPRVIPHFLYWYLLSEAHGRRQLNEAAYGAGKPGLNLDNIKSVSLSLPSPEEQAIVVERIEAALSVEHQFLQAIHGELQRTQALRHSILKRAFSGKLVAQDPMDQPASVLLERIRAERAGVATKKRGPKAKKFSKEKETAA